MVSGKAGKSALAAIVLAASVFLQSFSTAWAQLQVKTTSGALEGIAEKGATAFKGIPFAAPPVGEFRWRPPQPPLAWDGVRKADAFAASCMQVKAGERLPWTKEFMVQNDVSEDCLTLNVWTPRADPSAKLPVVVYIHGGSFREGSGAVDVYRGANLAPKGIVVVTINYRLGAFGFLAHPDLTAGSEHRSSGNYGLLDQIAALRWVKENIAQFGGDPHNVAIWGQSAGALSVAALVASPLAEGLFQRAQTDSGLGVAGHPMSPLSAAEQSGIKFAAEHNAASIKDLRALPADALVSVPDPKAGIAGLFRFVPIVDGWVLPDTPTAMNAAGTDKDVPMIAGYQADEPALYFRPIRTLDEYNQYIQKQYGDMAAEYAKLYPVAKEEDIKPVIMTANRDRNRVSIFLWASMRGKHHRQPIFIYYFNRAIPWPRHPEFGAFHTGEIPYFFANLDALDRPWETEDAALAGVASSYLVNFAAKGDPNGADLAPWPKAGPDQPQIMELGVRTGPMALAEKDKLDFWTRYFNAPISRVAL
jgi:para-nitrobenzyl esterase